MLNWGVSRKELLFLVHCSFGNGLKSEGLDLITFEIQHMAEFWQKTYFIPEHASGLDLNKKTSNSNSKDFQQLHPYDQICPVAFPPYHWGVHKVHF